MGLLSDSGERYYNVMKTISSLCPFAYGWYACSSLLLAGCATTSAHQPLAAIGQAELDTGRIAGGGEQADVSNPHMQSGMKELTLFIGFAGDAQQEGESDNSDGDFAVGLDLEYRVNSRWGIGGLVHVGGDVEDALIGVPVYYHLPYGDRWTLVGAPVVSLGDDEGEFGIRLGVTHALSIGGMTIKPSLYADLLGDEQQITLGIGIGTGL